MVLDFIQVTVDTQFMASWMVGDQSDSTCLQCVVDVLDIGLDLFGGMLQQQALLFLFVVRFHHFCNIASSSHDTMELSLLIAYRAEDGLVVTGSSEVQIWDTLILPFHLIDVGDRRQSDTVIQFLNIDMAIRGDVVDMYILF